APSAATAEATPSVPAAPNPDPAPAASPPATPSVPVAEATARDTAPPPASKPASGAAKMAAPKSDVAAPAPAPPAEPVRPTLPGAIFSHIKVLILGDDKPRDRDATLRLASDGFEVLDGTRALESAAWQDVIGLYYSHSKEPRWTNADGQSAAIAKSGGGGFGFLKS